MSRPGRLVLIGSGELAPPMVAAHRRAIEQAGADRVAILDTPYGFQENADLLSERIAEFYRTRLVIEPEVVTLRRTGLAPVEVERALSVVRRARVVFAGPGSPSYALRVWDEVGMGDALAEVLTAGGSVVFASAAALTAGTKTLPVYEIYKVGADPFWLDGLDLTGRFGLPSVVVPHWNNTEGGNHDTSRCFVGEARFSRLAAELEVGVLGVDEHTSAAVDFGASTLTVDGVGSVTVHGRDTLVLGGGGVPLDRVREALGAGRAESRREAGPEPRGRPLEFGEAIAGRDLDGALAALLAVEAQAADDSGRRPVLRSMLVELGDASREGFADPRRRVAGFVDLILELRAQARSEGLFEVADRIRDRLGELGVEVRDTADGVEWELST